MCEDCFLKYQSLLEEKSTNLRILIKKNFFGNNDKISQRVNERIKEEKNSLGNHLEIMRNAHFFIMKTSESEQSKSNISFIKHKNLSNNEDYLNNKKKWNFKLNLKNINSNHRKITSIDEYFNSERTTEGNTLRSKELTERYGTERNITEYFNEENTKIFFGINPKERRKKIARNAKSISRECFSEDMRKII